MFVPHYSIGWIRDGNTWLLNSWMPNSISLSNVFFLNMTVSRGSANQHKYYKLNIHEWNHRIEKRATPKWKRTWIIMAKLKILFKVQENATECRKLLLTLWQRKRLMRIFDSCFFPFGSRHNKKYPSEAFISGIIHDILEPVNSSFSLNPFASVALVLLIAIMIIIIIVVIHRWFIWMANNTSSTKRRYSLHWEIFISFIHLHFGPKVKHKCSHLMENVNYQQQSTQLIVKMKFK